MIKLFSSYSDHCLGHFLVNWLKFILSTITGDAIVTRTISVFMNAHSCIMTTDILILISRVFYAYTLFFWFQKFWDSYTLRFAHFPFPFLPCLFICSEILTRRLYFEHTLSIITLKQCFKRSDHVWSCFITDLTFTYD